MSDYSFDITYTEDNGEIYGTVVNTSTGKCSKRTARQFVKRLLGDRKFIFRQDRFNLWQYETVGGTKG